VQKLYSESGGRFLVTVGGEGALRFEKLVPRAVRIGTVGGNRLVVRDGKAIIDEDIAKLKASWQKTFRGFW